MLRKLIGYVLFPRPKVSGNLAGVPLPGLSSNLSHLLRR